MRFSPKTVGIAAAVITILIWSSFIVVARLMALRGLTPLDIVLCRFVGAGAVLLPWGYFMVRKMRLISVQRARSEEVSLYES